jgi:hypothetical protein
MKTTIKNFYWLSLTADLNGKPIVTFQAEGISMNFPLTNALEIAVCNEFLRSLDTGLHIEFESYKQYNELITDCATVLEEIQGGRCP